MSNETAPKITDLRVLLNPEKAILPWTERHGLKGLPPYSVEMHVTSFCNYSCYHCSYQKRRTARQKVSDEHIEQLLEDLVGLKPKGVYWSGGGEPTTMSHLADYIDRLDQAGIEQALVSNAILLTDRLFEVLPKLNYMAVSLQASDAETYAKITGCDKRDALYENVRKLRRIFTKTILGARSVINKYNYKEVPNIFRDAKELGFDYVIFIPAVDYENTGFIELNDAEKEELSAMILSMDSEIDDSYTNLRKVAKRRLVYYENKVECACTCHSNDIRATAFVNYDGGVWLCQPHIGKEEYCIGNLSDSRFAEMWNSPRHQAVIDKLNEEHKNGLCRNCRSISYNRTIEEFIKTGKGEKIRDSFL